MNSIQSILEDKTLNPKQLKRFFIKIEDKESLYLFREYCLHKHGIDFRKRYLNNYFDILAGLIYDKSFGVPFYINIYEGVNEFDDKGYYLSHQGWEWIPKEDQIIDFEKEFKEWKENAVPLKELITSELYPEYFI